MPNVQRMYKAPFLKNKKCDELLNLLELKEGCKRLKKKKACIYIYVQMVFSLVTTMHLFTYLFFYLNKMLPYFYFRFLRKEKKREEEKEKKNHYYH